MPCRGVDVGNVHVLAHSSVQQSMSLLMLNHPFCWLVCFLVEHSGVAQIHCQEPSCIFDMFGRGLRHTPKYAIHNRRKDFGSHTVK